MFDAFTSCGHQLMNGPADHFLTINPTGVHVFAHFSPCPFQAIRLTTRPHCCAACSTQVLLEEPLRIRPLSAQRVFIVSLVALPMASRVWAQQVVGDDFAGGSAATSSAAESGHTLRWQNCRHQPLIPSSPQTRQTAAAAQS